MAEDNGKMTKLATENFDEVLDVWARVLPFGKRVQVFRRLFGVEQEALADKLGITKQFVSRIERDEQAPGSDTLGRFRDTLGADLNVLYDSLKVNPKE
jgi:transcriptional regulator with XRE-family HTH domain